MKSPFKFSRHGQSGLWFPEIFPSLAKHADDLCLLNSMYTDVAVHPQAVIEMHTGNFRFQRPSMGAWTLYGLGTENSELPGFITINPAGGTQSYGSAFLPASYQGTKIDGGGPKQGGGRIANIENPKLSAELQRKQLDLLGSLNRERLEKDQVNPELEGLIESYELAFRMEGAVPAIMDTSHETAGNARRPTASAKKGPTISAGSACWPAGLPKRACGSSSWAWAAGTSTTTCATS